MHLVLELLDEQPDDSDILRFAQLIVYFGQREEEFYNSPEPLTVALVNDPRIDRIFCECSICGKMWVPRPFSEGAHRIITFDPPGGKCNKCGEVFCRECSKGYMCPNCNEKLVPIGKPTGRSRRQMYRSPGEVKRVVVFREGPVPPQEEDLTHLFKNISPDVLDKKPKVSAVAVSPWPHDIRSQRSRVSNALARENIFVPYLTLIDDFMVTSDRDGIHVYILKFLADNERTKDTAIQKMRNHSSRYDGFLRQYFSASEIPVIASQAARDMISTQNDKTGHTSLLIKPPVFYELSTIPTTIDNASNWFVEHHGGYMDSVKETLDKPSFQKSFCSTLCQVFFGWSGQGYWSHLAIYPIGDNSPTDTALYPNEFFTLKEKKELGLAR
jgi:hypothetical protein